MTRTHFYYPSCDSESTIHGCRWEPEGKPWAVVQIVHGIAEHIGRYDDFAAFLAGKGILVVAEDHAGHGRSIGEDQAFCYFPGGWFKAVQDTYRLLCDTKMDYPGLPYFILGHSMGSFMTRTLIAKHPDCGISGAIISGTGWIHRGLVNTCMAACTMLGSRGGYDKSYALLTAMAFGSYNDKIEHCRTEYDWLSRDPKVVDAYIADPYSGAPATAGILKDMMTGIRYIQEPGHIARMKKDLPILFISGSADPVGAYGKGVRQAVKAFQDAGMEDVSCKLYPLCRHELLNEINKEEVCDYLLQWLCKQV